MRNVKFTFIGAALSIGFATIATAADLPRKAPPMIQAPPPWSWQGFYAGGHVGYAFGGSDLNLYSDLLYEWRRGGNNNSDERGPGFDSGSATTGLDNRWFGGVHAGYNVQRGIWIYGIEADVNFGSSSSSTAYVSTAATKDPEEPPLTFGDAWASSKLEWYSTVRGKIGVANDRWMYYVTGGLAFGDISTSGGVTATIIDDDGVVVDRRTVAYSDSKVQLGFAVGAGASYAVTSNVVLGFLYQYVNLGSVSAAGTAVAYREFGNNFFDRAAAYGKADTDFDFHTVRFSVSYLFGGRW
jgi:outer membrane immunogenic protein